ncbi:MAG: hypothetical protein UT75_C0009G0001 [Candidatus Yanofskybacteria bacterium GW2011_GWE2_40_11]|uniref:Uncharacterized protein n=1 Tax=Candidatus Yanofskybacteria bacterium GW2011_GWE2_40_11 TaxID=1619033 RepID=A0A0G0QJE6_9BACT|nr:MAG: hypothetical protein UT75_C0009G0001 [Candidatus Yanofskybacteria bacterium GW2011_GWE2_40_11]
MEDVCYNCANDCPGVETCKPFKYKYYKQYKDDILDHERTTQNFVETIDQVKKSMEDKIWKTNYESFSKILPNNLSIDEFKVLMGKMKDTWEDK